MAAPPAEIPEPDRIPGAPHPRETAALVGHRAAVEEVMAAFAAGRVHHGWLVTGPRGVGKATLAWAMARHLLAAPAAEEAGLFAPAAPATLDIPADHPVARRTRALSEPRLFLLRRSWNDKTERLPDVITVDDVRRMKSFFTLTAADGGRRVALIDAADEMNPQAANAVLKLLEEPPEGAVLILIAHQPQRLLPTVRSRCRELRLGTLAPADLGRALAQAGAEVAPGTEVALAELAGGSPGRAFALVERDGLAAYAALLRLLGGLPRLDRAAMLALADKAGGRGGAEVFDQVVTLTDLFLTRLARAGTLGAPPPEAGPGEATLLMRLAPDPGAARGWADLAATLTARVRRGRAVNLDPAALLVDMFLQIDATAGLLASR
jgi:DNA polymerase-3 subunit delta'